MKTKRFYTLLLLEIVALGLISAYFLIDSSDIYRWYVGNTNFVKQSKNCDLHDEKCHVTLQDSSEMTLSITPRSIPLMKPLQFQVVTQGIHTDQLALKVYATNMNMGFHESTLKKVKENLYEGNITLPSCIVGNMIWNANIIANKTDRSVGAIFEFKTK
ncbi:hypothetical protein [Sulfurospirillum sp. 1612]|uniref:hypothetical protein n=1 Tax=Sulfurospirillum sp. 1612 TaxID=3094835 RepID=UPI002F9301A5